MYFYRDNTVDATFQNFYNTLAWSHLKYRYDNVVWEPLYVHT